ncbi:MAG: iron-containing alcohol dehydrogenase [Pseudomonadota bacterium]
MIDFNFFVNPQVLFGPGKLEHLPQLIKRYGNTVLIITGSQSFLNSDHWANLSTTLEKQGIDYFQAVISGEPTPAMIDGIVQNYRHHNINIIAAIGGGSVIDSGKAVSAMVTKKLPVVEYLEDVGTQVHDGKKIPFIAVPTTSGTGSEATKDADIHQVGKNGFKKSLRHDHFIPDIAIIDPELTINCPANITAASVIGGLFDIPHGVICGTLLAETTRKNIEELIRTDPNGIALKKYEEIAHLLDPSCHLEKPRERSHHLISLLDELTNQLNIPILSSYGLTGKDIDRIVKATKQKNNPIKLSTKHLSRILQARL